MTIDPHWVFENHKEAAQLIESLQRERDALQAELKKAVATLTDAGFTRCEGPAGWRPPLGKPAGPLIDRIDSLEAECEKLRKLAYIGEQFHEDCSRKPRFSEIKAECQAEAMRDAIDRAMKAEGGET